MREYKSVVKKITEIDKKRVMRQFNEVTEGVLKELRTLPTGELVMSYKDCEEDTFMQVLIFKVLNEKGITV